MNSSDKQTAGAGCPLFREPKGCLASQKDAKGTADDGEEALTYGNYLKLDELLSCQETKSPIHDEHLFVITHQAYELWFKQMILEIDSVRAILNSEAVEESKMLIVITRLGRVNSIMKLLSEQFFVLETMTPQDFLNFRPFLGQASGFQSLQFRLIENKIGVKEAARVRYNQQYYKQVFNKEQHIRALDASVNEPSLLDLVQQFLERTPGLDSDEFRFWQRYKIAVAGWLSNNFLDRVDECKDQAEKDMRLAEYQKEKDSFESVLNEDRYNTHVTRGERHLSYLAFQGAMMISLYKDEPRFHQPYQMLVLLQDLDSLFTKWRYNHVMLVQRMIGSKVGTGGSSGYQYLRATVSDRYKVFVDLFNLSTFLVPKEYIPSLSADVKRTLSVHNNMNVEVENGEAEAGRASSHCGA